MGKGQLLSFTNDPFSGGCIHLLFRFCISDTTCQRCSCCAQLLMSFQTMGTFALPGQQMLKCHYNLRKLYLPFASGTFMMRTNLPRFCQSSKRSVCLVGPVDDLLIEPLSFFTKLTEDLLGAN